MRNLQVGSFTQQNADALNLSLRDIRADFYVDGQTGFNGNEGTSPGLAFRSMSALNHPLTNYRRLVNHNQPITIAVAGVLTEEWSTPIVSDVTIIGAGNRPRQATTSGVANGGGATWLSPTSGTGALLTINGQAWTVKNLFFNNSATANPCVMLTNSGDTPLLANAEHTVLDGCVFTGTDDGVKSTGLPNWVTIQNCTFRGFSGASDLGIAYTVGAGTGTLLGWKILNNQFLGNTGHITAAFAGAEIAYNHFSYIFSGTTTTTQVVLTGGNDNAVHHNVFDLPFNTNLISGMFAGGTNDRWFWNYFGSAVTTTLASFSVPAT